ncbi:hypothetical protein HBI12_214090 [Parastagonospora nodorum]|nr:hypothetical protein HBI12_214090 [Parastagonospora nodorum]KAH5397910.1 hypothetical protein HBI47_209760 [Parastagonospora nodorum]
MKFSIVLSIAFATSALGHATMKMLQLEENPLQPRAQACEAQGGKGCRGYNRGGRCCCTACTPTFAARGANNSVSTVPLSRFECGGWPLLMQEVGRRGTRRQREGRGEERVRKMDASGFQSTIGFELRV